MVELERFADSGVRVRLVARVDNQKSERARQIIDLQKAA
jgi:hypothetical protein